MLLTPISLTSSGLSPDLLTCLKPFISTPVSLSANDIMGRFRPSGALQFGGWEGTTIWSFFLYLYLLPRCPSRIRTPAVWGNEQEPASILQWETKVQCGRESWSKSTGREKMEAQT